MKKTMMFGLFVLFSTLAVPPTRAQAGSFDKVRAAFKEVGKKLKKGAKKIDRALGDVGLGSKDWKALGKKGAWKRLGARIRSGLSKLRLSRRDWEALGDLEDPDSWDQLGKKVGRVLRGAWKQVRKGYHAFAKFAAKAKLDDEALMKNVGRAWGRVRRAYRTYKKLLAQAHVDEAPVLKGLRKAWARIKRGYRSFARLASRGQSATKADLGRFRRAWDRIKRGYGRFAKAVKKMKITDASVTRSLLRTKAFFTRAREEEAARLRKLFRGARGNLKSVFKRLFKRRK